LSSDKHTAIGPQFRHQVRKSSDFILGLDEEHASRTFGNAHGTASATGARLPYRGRRTKQTPPLVPASLSADNQENRAPVSTLERRDDLRRAPNSAALRRFFTVNLRGIRVVVAEVYRAFASRIDRGHQVTLTAQLSDARTPQPEGRVRRPRAEGLAHCWALAAVVIVAAGLRLWRLDRNGFGNPYYAAAIRSMLKTPSNFFFLAFDPVGFYSVDKPPLAFWLQATSARIFGYHGLSVLVPQALLGVGSVVLTYHVARRTFGSTSGVLAGLFLAITPVCFADDRTNLPDSALVFVLLLAACALDGALKTGDWRPLLTSAALLGAAYNVKLTAALLVVPAFALVWLIAAPCGVRARARRLAAAAAMVLITGLSWSMVVDLTPPSRRPHVGASLSNSALQLGLVANTFDKILGRRDASPDAHSNGMSPRDESAGGGPPGFGGRTGPLRFAQPLMAGQITWLVPLALMGAVAIAMDAAGRQRTTPALAFFGVWLGTTWAVFSFVRGHFHEYYTNVMGPPIAALAGAGAVALHAAWRRGGWRAALLPLALAATLTWQGFVLAHFPGWRRPLWPIMLAAGMIGMSGLGWSRVLKRRGAASWVEVGSCALVLASLLLAPSAWSLMPAFAESADRMNPLADPTILAPRRVGIPLLGHPAYELDSRGTRKLARFLIANQRTERLAMAAMDCFRAAPLIVEADLPVISLGGFTGSERLISPSVFESMVRRGWLRFVLISPDDGLGNPEIREMVLRHGRPVDAPLWRIDPPDEASNDHSRPAASPAMRSFFEELRRETHLYDLRPGLGLQGP
jgi:4-amino-4-deoxy-L-arabinose transferase-like glycosyltransferase